jgi:hypothetical protein
MWCSRPCKMVRIFTLPWLGNVAIHRPSVRSVRMRGIYKPLDFSFRSLFLSLQLLLPGREEKTQAVYNMAGGLGTGV